jgi:predicted porin
MKKHLIAAAVAAAVAVPAMAQDVQVYGRIDTGYSNAKTSVFDPEDEGGIVYGRKASGVGLANGLGASRIGFRGTEDLGGGLKAAFVFETQLAIEGSSALLAGATREASAAISGSFGTVKFGRYVNIGKSMKDSYTAFGGGGTFSNGSSTVTVLGANVNLAGDIDSDVDTDEQQAAAAVFTGDILAVTNRNNNLISYMSPKFNGFDVQVDLRLNKAEREEVGGADDATGHGIRLNYAAGPLAASAAYSDYTAKRRDNTTLAGALSLTGIDAFEDTRIQTDGEHVTKTKVTQLGATYTLGATKFFLSYAKFDQDLDGSTDGVGSNWDLDTVKGSAYDLGVTHAIGNTTLLASYGKGKIEWDGDDETKLTNYMVQASYALSKRTSAYAFYQNGKAKLDSGNDGTLSDKVYMLGIAHTF